MNPAMNVLKEVKFKGEHAIGLDISRDRIIATCFVRTGQDMVLDQVAVREIEPGSPDKLIARHIRDLWKTRKFSTHTVCSCLHSHSQIVRYFHYNNLTPVELPHALSLEAEEALQLPPDDVVMDWQLDSGGTDKGDLAGMLVAVPRDQVLRQIMLLREGGVYPASMDVSCSVLSRLCRFLIAAEDHPATCLISLTERTADIVMLSDGKSYPRTLFSVKDRWEDNQGYLLENIKDALLYYHLKVSPVPIEKILLAGRAPDLPALADGLAKATSMQVDVLDLFSDPRLSQAIQKEPAQLLKNCNLATGIGLGLRMPKNENK
jgi:Tfp pilus assembly PilM family ATPase